MPPKKKPVVKNDVEKTVSRENRIDAEISELNKTKGMLADKIAAYDNLSGDFQEVLKENEELNAKLVKIPVYDSQIRFVRKLDVIKVLKSNAKNEPDLKEWEIAITDKDIILKVTTLSNIHYEMSLNEAQQYQL